MAIPTAIVTVHILSLDIVPPATLAAGNTRYARAKFRAGTLPLVLTGRSSPIPDAGGSFSLTSEAVPWKYEVGLDSGIGIDVQVELCEDHGSDPAPSPQTVSGTISDPWTPGTRTFGSGIKFNVFVATKLVNPTDKAFLARAAKASGISGSLAVAQGFIVSISSIDGLYKPDPKATAPAPASIKVAGYLSDDNLGRIFVNRDVTGAWAKDTQFIDVSVEITAFGGPTLPSGTLIRWFISDVDDLTNDSPDFHREWGQYIDPNDYNTAGVPVGAHPGDNAGAFSAGNTDEDKLFGASAKGNARWAQIPGGPAPAPVSRTEATAPITVINPKLGKASVRIHCPNVLGTNFTLRAVLEGTPSGIRVFDAFTGIMTMWSRIDVEVVRMASAFSLKGALVTIPQYFLPACVQMDFQLERPVGGPLDKKNMAANDDHEEDASRQWVNNPAVFKHKSQGGWFFLGGARFASPLPKKSPSGPPPPLYQNTIYTLGINGNNPFVEVPGSFSNAQFVDFTWTDAAGTAQKAGFFVRRVRIAGGKTKISLAPNDVTPHFTGHDSDGSVDHAMATVILFFPQHQFNSGATAPSSGGFGVPSTGATVTVRGPGATSTGGISPPEKVGGRDFFAGRTVIFTKSDGTSGPPPDFDSKVLKKVVHEFLHAFGMPHKCGFWNWRTPRKKSCCMNYFNTWLIDPATLNLLPNTVGKMGDDMCGRHLMEVRRVHLEKNKGLKW